MAVCRAPEVKVLSGTRLFNNLSHTEKLYAHHAAKAAWHGTRIILRQVSPESEAIFDFIMQLYHSCAGDWEQLAQAREISSDHLNRFLEYAAMFLGDIGNYYGHGDQKFIPNITADVLKRLLATEGVAHELASKLKSTILATLPETLGLPSSTAQSAYYGSHSSITKHDIDRVTKITSQLGIDPENTRLMKSHVDGHETIDILQASVEKDPAPKIIHHGHNLTLRLLRGDHSSELQRVCDHLRKASDHTSDLSKQTYISQICNSLTGGDMTDYKSSQRTWVADNSTTVETVFGFVEPYRDPCGMRAEFEGIVGIEDASETALLRRLAEHANVFIKKLPWVDSTKESEALGDFEQSMVKSLNFVSIDTLAYCSTLVFPGVNLPNYNDIRRDVGSKNIMILNRLDGVPMAGDSSAVLLREEVPGTFIKHRRHAYYLWVVFHELFGHGTGKLLQQSKDGAHNFNAVNPPISPVTGQPIDSWYKPGETFTGVFQDLSTSVDECRAECIGAFLLSEPDLLAFCGYTDDGDIKPWELEYNIYQQLAIAGIRSLENYSAEEKTWGQAHSQGHFAMFQAIRRCCESIFEVHVNTTNETLAIRVRQDRIASHGRPALSQLLMSLHIFRSTADVSRCRQLMEELTTPSAECMAWRRILIRRGATKQVFVQSNTFVIHDRVISKDYDASPKGMIQSWAEREV